jgi:type VI secretion system protein ImpL
MFRKLLKLIFNRWTLVLLGLVAVAALIWFVGPLISIADVYPLEKESTRQIVIAVVIGLYIVKLVWSVAKVRLANMHLMDGLARQAQAPAAATNTAGAAEVAMLQKRFQDAVDVLKQLKKKKPGLGALLPGLQYLYELPWYVIVGAPGAGKTTALKNSGLKFPLAEGDADPMLKGVGGTRNCDWWFTDEAVLLDTAGRYTTQESDQEVDKSAWDAFLGLLKKYRPRRPINGTLVSISTAELLQQSPRDMQKHAHALRARIQELHERFGVRFPVYVLVTKVDLLPGFNEFFADYGREDRAQVWGVSFPVSDRYGLRANVLDQELYALEERLNQRLVERMQQERDPAKRALIYGFPQQFSMLRRVLADFVPRVLDASQYEVSPMVRGVYFTSATQESSPIDRIVGQLARAFRLEQRVLPSTTPTGKAYFITRLVKDVIFPEAGLAGTNIALERRRTLVEAGVLLLAGVVTVGALTAWTISYTRNRAYVARVDADVREVSKSVAALRGRTSPDVVALLPTLQAVRGLADASATAAERDTLSMRFGLYQGDKLAAASNAAYHRLLQDAFLPRLQSRIEELLRTRGPSDAELMYEGLKTYVMLSDPQHFDRDAVKAFITLDWDKNLPREVTQQQRKELRQHLDVLFSGGAMESPIVPDAQLVATARNAIARTNVAQRSYNRLRRLDLGAKFPEFTIAKAGGPYATQVFSRASGQPLTTGVPGLYTYDGYYKGFAKAADDVTKQLADEEVWVLGISSKDRPALTDVTGTGRLSDEVKRLYLQEYADIWERFVNDIKVTRTGSLQRTIELTQYLSAPESPLSMLSRAIVKEVTLTRKETPDQDIIDKTIGKATDTVRKTRDDLAKRLREKTGQPESVPSGKPLESIVDDRFDELRRLVQRPAPDQPAPIDKQVAMMGDLNTLLVAADIALRGKTAPPASDVPLKMKAEAARVPEPVRSILTMLYQASVDQTMREQGKSLSEAIRNELAAPCAEAIADRYPFVKSSKRDVTTDDFARFFRPGGLIDAFFQKNLVAFVDTTVRPWHVRDLGGANVGISGAVLEQFQSAQQIRDVFFPAGAPGPSLRLEFKAASMDASIQQFLLDIDGQVITYAHGPQVPTAVQWPGPKGTKQVRLQVSPPRAGKSGQTFEGPWALFRMMEDMKIDPSGQPEKFAITFNIDGRDARFDVTTNSVENPFRLKDLQQFQCFARG